MVWFLQNMALSVKTSSQILKDLKSLPIVGGWTNQVEKYANRQIGSFPQGSGWK